MNNYFLKLFLFFVFLYLNALYGQEEYYKKPSELIAKGQYAAAIPAAREAANSYLSDKKPDVRLYFYCYTLVFQSLDFLDKETDFLKYEKELNTHYQRSYFAIQVIKNIAVAYQEKGDLQKAQSYFEKAVAEMKKLRHNSDNILLFSEIYNDFGVFYKEIGDFEQALRFYRLAVKELLSEKDINHSELQIRYVNIAFVLQEKKDYANALLYEHKAKAHANKEELKDIYIELINTHLSLDKIDSAELYLKKLLPFIPKISKREQGRCRKFEAQVAFEKGELSHAETCVRAAIPLRKDDREGLLQSYILLGKIYEKQDKIAAAHEAFQRALEYAKNPATKDFLFKNEALTIFQHQIALHNAQQYHKQAITTCDSADLLISALRQLYETDESKLFLAQNVKKLYEEGIIAAAALQDIDKAFYYSEKCKAVLLYASIKANEAANSLPKSAQDSLVSLKNSHDIATFQTQKGNNSEKNIDAMQQYTQYLKQLEQRYPEYAQKKRTTVSSLPQIKAYLPQNQLMIAYFWGEKRQFCFVLEKEKQTIFPINAQKDSLKSLLVSIETKKSRIEQQAKAAYLQLIPPQLQQNTSLRWLIIPDGILHKLPFEALIKEGKYLVHSHAISYSYSATIWQNPSQNADSKEDIVIAPPFNAYKTYQPSLGDLQEKKFLQAFPNATIWEGKRQDIVAAFSQEKNKNYHFIYAYTHSFSDSLPQNCRIVLADTFLTIKDIESLHIHADLWILASCESGLGRFHEGEGVMSLARSFIHAGCRSVMPTLWKANAESVRKILEYFDAYITEGYAKDIALQKAKIQYLAESESENRLPDMWAMQILIGDAGVCSHQGSWWKWLIGGIAVLGAVYIARRFSQI